MQLDIHPKYDVVNVKCSCGFSFDTRSTDPSNKKKWTIEVCSSCHPWYTGQQRLVDTGGHVDKFNKKFASFSKKLGTAKN